MAIILLLGAVGFSFLIAILVQFYISRRLLYLVNIMKQVNRTGDYNTPPIADEGKDEISILIQVFNNLMQQVKENQTRKDEFIGIASHELKTPLTSVKGYLDLLNKIEDKQPNKQFAQKALENVYKLERLVKDLLDVSKIQSGQLQLNTKEFNIDELIGETIASIQIVSATHKINRENTSGDLVISADRQRIEQVLLNLLSNAIKYSPGETEVMISSEKTGSDLIIRVRDFGIGIPKEELPEIFERFYRTKDISVYISGFGLGLYICRNIILRHNGKIWAERENKGSSFYFSLPL
jgi:signal transduction histidine kinase